MRDVGGAVFRGFCSSVRMFLTGCFALSLDATAKALSTHVWIDGGRRSEPKYIRASKHVCYRSIGLRHDLCFLCMAASEYRPPSDPLFHVLLARNSLERRIERNGLRAVSFCIRGMPDLRPKDCMPRACDIGERGKPSAPCNCRCVALAKERAVVAFRGRPKDARGLLPCVQAIRPPRIHSKQQPRSLACTDEPRGVRGPRARAPTRVAGLAAPHRPRLHAVSPVRRGSQLGSPSRVRTPHHRCTPPHSHATRTALVHFVIRVPASILDTDNARS
jgi:hypothetical protein